MTYQEALESKQLYGDIIYDNGIPNYVIITPSLKNEWSELLTYIKDDFSLYNDELCKEYCSNNDYTLRGAVTEEGKKKLHGEPRFI